MFLHSALFYSNDFKYLSKNEFGLKKKPTALYLLPNN